MLSLKLCVQGKLAEAYIGLNKIEKIIHIYEETREKVV